MKPAIFTEADFHPLKDLIRARTGLVFPQSRQRDLETALHRTMADSGTSDLDRFIHLLETDERVFDALIAGITVAETYFFREPSQFDVIRRQILPDLRKRLPAEGNIRIWSAGCASGEEPYSLAILMEQEGLAERATILGTDISRAALARAREAAYSTWSLRDGVDDRSAPCFERRGDRFMLRPRFRRCVDFKYLNLATTAYPSPITATTDIDLIICRNVLIYFDQETIRHVARQFFASLRPGGWLITGPSDPPLWDHAPYRTLVTTAGILYRRDGDADSRMLAEAAGGTALRLPEPHAEFASPSAIVPSAAMARRIDTEAPPAVAEPDRAPDRPDERQALIAQVRALADRGRSREAEVSATAALRSYPLCAELHYLQAIILIELGRHDDAIAALRRVLYLDPSLAIVHFTLGSMLSRRGAVAEARRTYQSALTLCLARPREEILPLSDAEPTMNLIEATRAQLARIDGATEARNARR